MFTGLVEAVGKVAAVTPGAAGLELSIECPFDSLVAGESIAVNGACLTVRIQGPGFFTAAAVVTTLERTSIGHWQPGTRVNLERALRLGDRLGGHLLQGHIDCVGRIAEVVRRDDAVLITAEVREEIWDLFVPQGSIALDGVSLTVNAIPGRCLVQVSLIEHTLSHTTLAQIRVDDEVHVEADVLGKYVRQLLAPYLSRSAQL